jgi:hypothetical protein
MSDHIAFLDLSTKTDNLLRKRFGYSATINQIERASDEELLCIPQFGLKCLQEVREHIGTYRNQQKGENAIEH